MFVIAGVTGHVGSIAAKELLSRGKHVRVLVRNGAKGEVWSRQGAKVAVVDLNDLTALTDTLRGSDGFFVLLPTNVAASDFYADQRQTADSIAAAVQSSGVPHVVMLSAIGADLAEGTGPIIGLHYLENRLRETGVVLTALRSGHFQEKVEAVLGAAQAEGVYPTFGDSAETPVPMIATRDVGAVVAEALLSPPATSEVIDIEGPAYTEHEVAEKLGAVLGRPLQVINIPRPGWVDAMVEGGIPHHIAEVLADLYDADQRGILKPRGDRHLRGRSQIDETLRNLVRSVTEASR